MVVPTGIRQFYSNCIVIVAFEQDNYRTGMKIDITVIIGARLLGNMVYFTMFRVWLCKTVLTGHETDLSERDTSGPPFCQLKKGRVLSMNRTVHLIYVSLLFTSHIRMLVCMFTW